jgi:MFS transporter, CP family, cyanate transporter
MSSRPVASPEAVPEDGGLALAGLILGAGVTAALHVGKLPPLIPVLRAEMGLDLVRGGFLLSVMQLAGMMLGVFAGLLADRLGLRRTMLLGLGLLSLGTLTGALAADVTALLAARVLEGAGLLCTVLPAPGLLRRLVRDPRALSRSLGVWGAFMPVGTALAILCGPALYLGLGWRWTWVGLAVLTLTWAGLVWRHLPRDPATAPVRSRPGMAKALRATLGAPGPWLLGLAFMVYSGQWLAVVGFLPTMQSQAGWPVGWIGPLSALVAGANALGNVAAGRMLGAGWAPGRVLFLGYAAMGGASVLAFGLALGPVTQFVAVWLFSALGGLVPGTLFSVAVRLAPAEHAVSTTVGWMQQCSSLGQFAGPPLVAALVARAGGDWAPTAVVTGACSLAGLWLASRLQSRLACRG